MSLHHAGDVGRTDLDLSSSLMPSPPTACIFAASDLPSLAFLTFLEPMLTQAASVHAAHPT